MGRTGWAIEKKVAGSWVSDGTIYRPNDSLGNEIMSTQQTVPLANGSNAYITPETKYLEGRIQFTWFWDDGAIESQVEGYVKAQDDLKITDHDGNLYIGRFIGVNSTQFVGEDPDRYNLTANFERMPGLA